MISRPNTVKIEAFLLLVLCDPAFGGDHSMRRMRTCGSAILARKQGFFQDKKQGHLLDHHSLLITAYKYYASAYK
jgi:hypothetical protein